MLFMSVPDSYYTTLREKLSTAKITVAEDLSVVSRDGRKAGRGVYVYMCVCLRREISEESGIEIFFKKYLHKVQMGYLYHLHFGMSTCTLDDTCMVVHVFFKL